jgi:hypothetical protein
MPPRVTDSDVTTLLPTSAVGPTPFILAANQIVDDIAAKPGAPDALRLKEIERWLAAHMLASHQDAAQVTQARDGNASMTRMGQFGSGLDSTPFGQTAKQLDPTGHLKNLSLKRASAVAL